MKNWVRLGILALLLLMGASPAVAQQSGSIQLGAGVEYQLIARWDVERLNANP